MKSSLIKQKLAAGETVLCAKACYQDPELVELMASSGVDALWICLEHKKISPEALYSMIQACRLGGAEAIVRVKPANYTDLLPLLESGARGIMLPRVRHPDEVRQVVDAIKFYPEGRRGYDGIHVEADFGRLSPHDYFAEANGNSLLVVQIEEPEVIPYIDEIAAIPGVDILFVGPGDLSLGLGKFGKTEDPEIVSVIDRVATACAREGKVAAIPCAPDQVQAYQKRGYRFLNIFSDYRGVVNGLKLALQTART
ncbi:MAG TPA: aldolase/citrate lyase family protein [Opitutaceae bacterium]|nr:aldolase/citrate lyase family protein [Opitutaceae bacterium]